MHVCVHACMHVCMVVACVCVCLFVLLGCFVLYPLSVMLRCVMLLCFAMVFDVFGACSVLSSAVWRTVPRGSYPNPFFGYIVLWLGSVV